MSTEHTIRPPAPPSLETPEGPLRLRWSDAHGARVLRVERTSVLGSSEHVDVAIDDKAVSRVHAEIQLDGPEAWVRDLGSSNGTFLDGVEVKVARLRAGQLLRIGGTEIRVEAFGFPAAHDVWPESRFGPLLGRSAVMRELFATLARVATTDVPVFVRGETGTGKELVARAIHEASPRRTGPYVVVDCAALADNLLESELFGHARGAFTGATSTREGAIEAATGGTVFLDEIGELPLDMQPKLLRVLEQRTVRRVGESEHRPVDVRFVAATHRDLVDFVARGWFREDLYFRLAVLPVRIPPLRERMEDLELLCRHFLGPTSESLVTPSLLADLKARPWRGNVRELRNFLDRARTLGVQHALQQDEGAAASGPSVPPPVNGEVSLPPSMLELSHREFRERWGELGEKAYLAAKLNQRGGNVSRVAREVELARTYMHKLIKKHGL